MEGVSRVIRDLDPSLSMREENGNGEREVERVRLRSDDAVLLDG